MITLKIMRDVPITSKWRKGVNISHIESRYDVRFRFCEILQVKIDEVSMKKSWISPLVST